jgi:hypothetical protein
MLDPWIIEEIRRREEEEQRREERPVLELPLEFPVIVPTGKPAEDNEERGVVIVDFSV